MKKRTKIVATIGPASDSQESIEKLIYAGVNVFRLNFSHGTHAYHSEVLARIRTAVKKTGLITGVLQDISGPKVRIGELDKEFFLKIDDILEFVKEEVVGTQIDENTYRLTLNQKQILDKLKVGEYIYLYDGLIRSKVIEVAADKVRVVVQNDGILSSKKGINFPHTKLGLDIITKKDREDMLWGIQNDVDFMAISFVQNADDMKNARAIVEKEGASIELFAKIEKFDAVENIDEILKVSDGIMVARGDLGIEIPYYDVPNIQKMLIKKANDLSKPVITATQMLLSMTRNNRATRAEISDIANAVLDGSDAVMLSEESAIGHNPPLAVQTMLKTIQATEKNFPYYKLSYFDMHDMADNINDSAVRLSQSLQTDAILTITSSGNTAKKMARYRPSQPIYAVTHSEKTAKTLTMVWGVVPAFSVSSSNPGTIMNELITQGLERGVLDIDKRYILTVGDPLGVVGSTNMIRIISKYEMNFFKALKNTN